MRDAQAQATSVTAARNCSIETGKRGTQPIVDHLLGDTGNGEVGQKSELRSSQSGY